MNEQKEHDLTRFLDAQASDFNAALQELAKGRKPSHWMCGTSSPRSPALGTAGWRRNTPFAQETKLQHT